MKLAERLARRHLARSVADPELRARLTPDYTLGCKRVLLSDDYYPAVARANVELVTDPIREVQPSGVVTAGGRLREADAIVYGTGFRTQDPIERGVVFGRGGLDLVDAWSEGPEAYLGTTVHGFPNLFLLVGPNTGLGHSSIVYMIESQVQYVMEALRAMRARGLREVEVRAEVQRRFNEDLRRRHRRTVWSSGCRSWYLRADGRNTTLWPGFTFGFRWRTRAFRLADYRVAGPPA